MRTAREFWAKVERTPECWEWIAGRGAYGYGILNWRGTVTTPHRLVLELVGQKVPPGISVHHICGNRLCVRPGHLQVVTQAEHSALHRREQCKYGHPLSGDNLGVTTSGKNLGMRYCRTCLRLKSRLRNGSTGSGKNFVTPTRHRRILELSASGLTNVAVAKAVGVSPSTVGRALRPTYRPFVPALHCPDASVYAKDAA